MSSYTRQYTVLMADNHSIPKGKIHSNCRLVPDHILCNITQRNNIRRANTCDPSLKLLNEEITSDIQNTNKHMEGTLRYTLGSQTQHAHSLEDHTRGLSNREPPPTLNTSITFINKTTTTHNRIANCFTKQFTNTIRHATHKTNRYTSRATHKIQGYNITLTTLKSMRQYNKVKITTHKVLTN